MDIPCLGWWYERAEENIHGGNRHRARGGARLPVGSRLPTVSSYVG